VTVGQQIPEHKAVRPRGPTSPRTVLTTGRRDRLKSAYVGVTNVSDRGQILAVVAVSLLVGVFLYRHVLPDDFSVYREASVRLLGDSDEIYAQGSGLPFSYPPIAVVIFAPLALVPGWLGAAAILAASLVSLGRCARVLSRWLELPDDRWLVVAGAMLVVEPVIATVAYGQLNVILAAMVLTTLDSPAAGRGAWLGLAAAMKLTPAIFLAPLLFKGSWQRFRTAVGASLLATGIGFVVLPEQSVQYWRSTLLDTSRVGGAEYAGDQSLNGALWRWLGPGGSTVLWALGVLGVLALVVLVNLRATSMPVAALATAMGGLLVSPISWTHHWVWAAPVAMLIWRLHVPVWSRVLAWGWAIALLTWTVWWLPHNEGREYGLSAPLQLLGNAYVLLGLASLVFLLVSARRDIRPREAERDVRQPLTP
jgi:alpha-1,2-mannosyltransferase